MLIDGLNVAYWCGTPASLRIPLSLLLGLLQAGFPARVILDASARHRLQDGDGLPALIDAFPGHLRQVPSGVPADRELIRCARVEGGRIISRDRFRDHRRKFRRFIDTPGCILAGGIEADRIRIPHLEFSAALHSSSSSVLPVLREVIGGLASPSHGGG